MHYDGKNMCISPTVLYGSTLANLFFAATGVWHSLAVGLPTLLHAERLLHSFATCPPRQTIGKAAQAQHRTGTQVAHCVPPDVGERGSASKRHASRRWASSRPAAPQASSCRARRLVAAAQAVVAAVREAACGTTFRGGVRRSPGTTAHARACLRSTAGARNGTERLQAPPRSRSALRTQRAASAGGWRSAARPGRWRRTASCKCSSAREWHSCPTWTHTHVHTPNERQREEQSDTVAKSPFHRKDVGRQLAQGDLPLRRVVSMSQPRLRTRRQSG